VIGKRRWNQSRVGLATALLAVGVCLSAALCGCEEDAATDGAPPPPRIGPTPNIVFILIDTLRSDMLGSHGNLRRSTPALDAIAAEGVDFARAVTAAPWTQPAVASLFCSRYPGAHGVLDYRLPLKAVHTKDQPVVAVMDEGLFTLAECLQKRGYATAGFSANPFITRGFGFAQGFEHFDDSFADNTTSGEVVNRAAMAWLERRDPGQPFFLYLHYMDPHGPYDTGPEYLDPLLDEVEQLPEKHILTDEEKKQLGYLRKLPGAYTDRQRHVRLAQYREYWVARYEAGVRDADTHIAALRDALAGLGVWDDAWVVVLADHGEALCEHGFWEHGFSTHHTDLHVPLILRWPGTIPAGTRVARTVRLIDVFPTVVDQLALPEPLGIQGTSLAPFIAGRPPSDPLMAFAEGVKLGPGQRACYVGDWKAILTMETGRLQLYNITNDPLEQMDLATLRPQRTAEFRSLIDRQAQLNADLLAGVSVQRAPLSREQIEHLESLGYVGGAQPPGQQ